MPKKTLKQKREEIRDMIVQNGKEGKIVTWGLDDTLIVRDLDEFIKQPAEGILYDLNRDSATVLTFIDKPKWVNDYAVGLVIEKLKSLLDKKEGNE